MTTRKIYKSLELGLDRSASQPEGEQSLRVARKLAGSLEPKRSLEEIIYESGEYTRGTHNAAPEYKPTHHEAPSKAPKAPKAAPRKAAPRKTSSKTPKEFPLKCEYQRRDFTKKTAFADACRRLKIGKGRELEEYTYNKKLWVFSVSLPDNMTGLDTKYGEARSRQVGEDKDITYTYLPRGAD